MQITDFNRLLREMKRSKKKTLPFEARLTAVSEMLPKALVDCVQLGEEYLKQQRAESVANVKRTNGRLRLEEKVRDANGSDDDWQD